MSDDINSDRANIWVKLGNKEYRDRFVSSNISTTIAAQLYHMREQRGWTQTELAERADMAQSRISLMEDPSYERFSLSTLKRLASAFDVALIVRFVPFHELLDWVTNLTPQYLSVPSFQHDKPGRAMGSDTGTSSHITVLPKKEPAPSIWSIEGRAKSGDAGSYSRNMREQG